jgi:superfamily II RNA helicase
VHFTQNEAAQAAQDLMSLNFCSAAEKAEIKELMAGREVHQPVWQGGEESICSHGVGIHHAGLLPKYRVLVEKLAQRGLLKVICGTDTLGVGVNVPIRTVLLTKRLSKYSGEKVATLTARDFHQITGRAGRRGFDDVGYVVCAGTGAHHRKRQDGGEGRGRCEEAAQDGEEEAAGGFRRLERGYLQALQAATPEPLVSRFQVSHGMLLQVLSRSDDGCARCGSSSRDSHETANAKKQHEKRAWQLFRALVQRKIVEILPPKARAPMAARSCGSMWNCKTTSR